MNDGNLMMLVGIEASNVSDIASMGRRPVIVYVLFPYRQTKNSWPLFRNGFVDALKYWGFNWLVVI